MASWGPSSYDNDEVMDRVGDIWRNVLDELPIEVICTTLEQSFNKRSNDEAANLWKMCTIELPEVKLRRLACLSTPDPRVANDFLEKIGSRKLNGAIVKCVVRSGSDEWILAGVVSYFATEIGLPVDAALGRKAIEQVESRLATSADPEEKNSLQRELLVLRNKIK